MRSACTPLSSIRTPASDSVTPSRECDTSAACVAAGGLEEACPPPQIGNYECRIRSNRKRLISLMWVESFFRHKLKVLTAKPCSRQNRRAPIPLAFQVVTISPQNFSPCRGDVCLSLLQPLSSHLPSHCARSQESTTFTFRMPLLKTGSVEAYD
jgi:hypothetical protein